MNATPKTHARQVRKAIEKRKHVALVKAGTHRLVYTSGSPKGI